MQETEKNVSRLKEIAIRGLIFILSLAVIIVVWYFYAINTNPIIFAEPQRVASALISLMGNGKFLGAVENMLGELFLGFGLSVITGIPIGLIMGRVKIIDEVLDPYMTAFYVLPRVAMVPLFIIWFGLGILSTTLFIYTFSFFPIILTVSQGVKNTDKLYLDVARVGTAKEIQIFTKVIIPSSLPYIFAGLRIGLSLAYIGVIIEQLDMVVHGVGAFLFNAQEFYQTDVILAILVILAIIGFVLSEIFKYMEKRMTHGLRFSTLSGL